MAGKAVRLILGILLLPVDLGYAFSFTEQLAKIEQIQEPQLVFLLGITAYLAFHVLVTAPTRAYVLGHELIHVTAAWVSGGKVQGLRVGKAQGSVATDKITAFVALAPYLVPVYAVLWALGFGLAGLFWNMKPWTALFFFGLGATLAFHLVFTVNVLKQKQSDLEVLGPLLGIGLIVWGNLTIVAGVMSSLIPEVRFLSYFTEGWARTQDLYQLIFTQLFAR